MQGVQHISSITKLMRIHFLFSLSLLSVTHTHTHIPLTFTHTFYRCSRADDCSLPSPRDLDRADVLMDTFLRDPSLLSTARNSESKLFPEKFSFVLVSFCVHVVSYAIFDVLMKIFLLDIGILFFFFVFPISEQRYSETFY